MLGVIDCGQPCRVLRCVDAAVIWSLNILRVKSYVRLSEEPSVRGLDLHPNGSLFTTAIAKGSCRGSII